MRVWNLIGVMNVNNDKVISNDFAAADLQEIGLLDSL